MNKSLVESNAHRLPRTAALTPGECTPVDPDITARRSILERFQGEARQSEYDLRCHGYLEIAHLVAVAELATTQALAKIDLVEPETASV